MQTKNQVIESRAKLWTKLEEAKAQIEALTLRVHETETQRDNAQTLAQKLRFDSAIMIERLDTANKNHAAFVSVILKLGGAK